VIDAPAKTFLGTPFRHQGRTPGLGLDCVGVVVCALQALGVPVNDRRTYKSVPPKSMLSENALRHGFTEVKKPPQRGDILLFWMRNKRLVIHCGICTGSGHQMIHVEAGRRVEFVPLRLWLPQLSSVYRMESD